MSVMPRVGIIGCGDVAHRHYLPALAKLTDRVVLAGCSDPRLDAAERAAASARAWSPEVGAFSDPAEMIRDARLDAVFNLSPAPLHAVVSTAALETGVHVYSEKPIAGTLADADRLIELARASGARRRRSSPRSTHAACWTSS